MQERFRRFAWKTAEQVGSHWAFFLALLVILGWLVTGPVFRFSDTWQLAINTGTTVVTFLMVFLIQATQNRDAKAIHLKLDELIRAQRSARNIFADLEDASTEEIEHLQEEFKKLRAKGVARREAVQRARPSAEGRSKR